MNFIYFIYSLKCIYLHKNNYECMINKVQNHEIYFIKDIPNFSRFF